MLKTISWTLLILILILGLLTLFLFNKLAKQSEKIDPQLGVTDHKLTACPGTPNCINSQSTIESENIQPFSGGRETFVKLVELISSEKSATIINQTDNYLHATYKSKLFGFIDDVEIYLKDDTVEVRSASRTGKSDLGANRKRIERLRSML
jgi:uncharacterized protein (DUF1499 family)